MTSIIKFHVLSGAMDDSPPCYLLQIDDVKILLDCGWNEHFDQNFITELCKYVKHIDLVLLSHPDVEHLGALPYLVGKCGLSCPIYSTIPVYKMGQMFMYDLYQSRSNNEEFTLFNLDDVDAAFDQIVQLKYNQTVTLKGKCHGISVIPVLAGHMIGGTMWKILKAGEGDIIYAVDFNHKKERHLNGCTFDSINRPALMIINAFDSTYYQERRRIRDEKLMTNILQTLSNNGNVLIAIDTAGRVLELAHMLDQLWGNKNSGLQKHSLCILNNVSYNVIEFAKSQIEWMSDKLMKTFECARYNPFHFKYTKTCHSLKEIHKISSSKVVLASTPDLECGFSRSLCLEWLSDRTNSIILTKKCRKGTLARELIDLPANQNQNKINVAIKRREKLTREELADYCVTQNEHDTDSDSSNSDDVQLVGNVVKSHDFIVKHEKNKRKSYPIFPEVDVKKKYDEYGEIICISDYKKEVKEISKREDKIEEEVMDLVEVPTKCVSFEQDIEVKASIQLIQFEGESDGESVQKFIWKCRPRGIILIRSPASDTMALASQLSQGTDAKVYSPAKGESIDIATEVNIYQIRLTDGLVSSLNIQEGDREQIKLAWVDGIVTTNTRKYLDEENDVLRIMEVDKNDNIEELTKSDNILALDLLQDKNEIVPHSTLFVNEIKFANLKQTIVKSGINCEISGGVLLCSNRSISIRRDIFTRKIVMEGCLSEDYYKLRSLLYGHLAIL